jgi:hypothetical protein
MTFEMVDAERRLAERRGQRGGDAGADQQRTGQPWAARVRDDADRIEVGAGRCQDFARQRQDPPDVVARGELGNDAAVVGMHLDLAVQGLGEESAASYRLRLQRGRCRSRRRRFRCRGRASRKFRRPAAGGAARGFSG